MIITPRFMPNPSMTTADWRIIFDVHLIPESKAFLFFQGMAINIPAIIANMGPPITGKCLPKNHAGIDMIKQIKIPSPFFLIKLI